MLPPPPNQRQAQGAPALQLACRSSNCYRHFSCPDRPAFGLAAGAVQLACGCEATGSESSLMEDILYWIVAGLIGLVALAVILWALAEILGFIRWVFPSKRDDENGPFE